MILYFTTHRTDFPTDQWECPRSVCRMHGFSREHVCFSTVPQHGFGQYSFIVDAPEAQAIGYEYTNEFSQEGERCFALPPAILKDRGITRELYSELTGLHWNEWEVKMLDREPNPKDPNNRGEYSLLWTSREGIATARIAKREPEVGEPTKLVLTVRTTEEFNPEIDYIVVERHEEHQRDFGLKETWEISSVGGNMPRWGLFPKAWKAWVWNDLVKDSALTYIVKNVPEVDHLVGLADSMEINNRKANKVNVIKAWRDVADKIGAVMSAKTGSTINLGELKGLSWTAVAAMPHRIARRLSQNLPYAEWTPPIEAPEFENPDESGRYLLANHYGPFPKKGPGVDRPSGDAGGEGVLAGRAPFVNSQIRLA